MEMKCSACGAMMNEAHCSKCKAPMTCTAEKCSCACGNEAMMNEVKCDACLNAAPAAM